MADDAADHAENCASMGRLEHSISTFASGENLAQGGYHFSSRAIVNGWLYSKGPRKNLLNYRAQKAGVGIAKSRGETYVVWIYSNEPPSYPDCPYYESTYMKIKSSLKQLFSWK
jgi:uncharacterized protein YkwD